jgi:ubiquinone/menaquinone biosynthesis C-methylase UbiE
VSISAAIKSVADESRMRIVNLLSLGSFNVQELTQLLGSSQSTISHHLKNLQAAGVLRGKKDGTWSYFSISQQTPEGALALELVEKVAAEEGSLFDLDMAAARELLNHRRDKSKTLFDSLADSWHHLREETHGRAILLDEVAKQIPDGVRVLDLGCGSGALLERIMPRDGGTIGVDSSPAMLEQARKMVGSKGDVDLRLGLLQHLPIADEDVDLAVAFMVLHHVPELEPALLDAHRALSCGGKLMIVDRNQYDSKLMQERFGEQWIDFSTKQLEDMVRASGFTNIDCKSLGGSDEAFVMTGVKDLS